MKNRIVEIDTRQIFDWESFHSVFAAAFGFPDFYGRNMNAWIDCLSDLDNPNSGMSAITVSTGQVVVLQLQHAKEFAQRCPEIYQALIECLAFVNCRRIEHSEEPVLTISFHN